MSIAGILNDMNMSNYFIGLFIFILLVSLIQFLWYIVILPVQFGSFQLIIQGYYSGSQKNYVGQDLAPTTRTKRTKHRTLVRHSGLTYQNPKTYNGPIVEGWPPSKNRNVQQYITQPFTSAPNNSKLNNKTLVVIVPSLPSDIAVRESCRETWGKYANIHTSVLFLLGNEVNLKSNIRERLSEEKLLHGDIIQVNGLVEHYNNLTLKSLYAIKFFLEGFEGNLKPRFLMKVDDDNFVNLPLLYNQLVKKKKYSNAKALLMGHCWCHRARRAKVYPYLGHHVSEETKDKVYESRTTNGGRLVAKWIVPSYMYNKGRYPNYLSGAGYVLSRTAAGCIYESTFNIPFFHLEDIYVTGFAAQACQINHVHNRGFVLAKKGGFNKETDVLLHYFKPGFMDKVKMKFSRILSHA